MVTQFTFLSKVRYPPTGIESTPLRNSDSKVVGLQEYATTPGVYVKEIDFFHQEIILILRLTYFFPMFPFDPR